MITRTIKRVTKKPTTEDPDGLYEVVDLDGIYWGLYCVFTNWYGARGVCDWNEHPGITYRRI